jgi:hypothetical protein
MAHGTRFSWNSTVRTEPSKEARAQPPLSFLAASFFSLKLKKSVEVGLLQVLLRIVISKICRLEDLQSSDLGVSFLDRRII